ncbi:unnamed protein product [Blepharisma stoltei]|uniref:Uncharacterized protein n=1 Tax=Blepharisma stoltei TaxID=1481888 RepID=A0AAU9IXR8_9CILI|nr:unnamed protein product [Blepharisma stoltei]
MEEFNCWNLESAINLPNHQKKRSLDITNSINTDSELNISYRSENNSYMRNQPKYIQLAIPSLFKANSIQLRGRGSSTNPSTPSTSLWRKPSLSTISKSNISAENCSLSPKRCLIPMSKVSSCEVNLPIKFQEDLLKRTMERKALAQVVKLKNDREISVESHRRPKEGDDKPLNASKKLFEKESSTYKIACSNSKEMKYTEIYARQQQMKENALNTTVLGVSTKLNITNGVRGLGYSQKRRTKGQENLTIEVKHAFSSNTENEIESPFSSKDLEQRYNKLTGQLDYISKRIQDVIGKCSD